MSKTRIINIVDGVISGHSNKPRTADTDFSWVSGDCPGYERWGELGAEWVKLQTQGLGSKLQALATFIDKYLFRKKLAINPEEFLSRKYKSPDFYNTTCADVSVGVKYASHINDFLTYILEKYFSERDDYDRIVVSPAFHNPVSKIIGGGGPRPTELVRSPLPYGYIDELRRMLCQGANFSDWTWAHDVLEVQNGNQKGNNSNWVPVEASLIDKNDPDCVWRDSTHPHLIAPMIWSPVRWVALLVKLILPLRTFQVRMLDSGEFDYWRYDNNEWFINSRKGAKGTPGKPHKNGVFRRKNELIDGEDYGCSLYVNTNKTADIGTSAAGKGYEMPWHSGIDYTDNVYYWLEKLRNWQEKYNPIEKPTSWMDLDTRHIPVKTEFQLSGYPDTAFLFRRFECKKDERNLPITEGDLGVPWYVLLESLQNKVAARGELRADGKPHQFVPPSDESNGRQTTLYPLHSLRVSLITALALDGNVSFAILQKLVGHSRLLMTLYYVKIGATRTREVLEEASKHLLEGRSEQVQRFLADSSHEHLLKTAICNSTTSLAAAVPIHPAARNPLGWMPMHHGLCLVGGNTSEIEGNGNVGGCHNGGSNIGTEANPKFGPVSGGARNCVRCRWFVTQPQYLPALVAHFNTLAYHFDEARNVCMNAEQSLLVLKRSRADAEDAGLPFTEQHAFKQAERLYESSMKRFSDMAEDLVACWRLAERCRLAGAENSEGEQFLAVGDEDDVGIAFEDTKSELLQLTVVCNSVEIYPELQAGKAVFRRTQLLDRMLYNENLLPLFMTLSEEDQLIAGNAFMRRLAKQVDPANPALGCRKVIQLIDAGARLSEHFELDLTSLLNRDGAPVLTRNLEAGDAS